MFLAGVAAPVGELGLWLDGGESRAVWGEWLGCGGGLRGGG